MHAIREEFGSSFAGAVQQFGPRPLMLGHFDPDGLSAAAILQRALTGGRCEPAIRIVGKGEQPWSGEMRRELAEKKPGGLIVTDPGVGDGALLPDTPPSSSTTMFRPARPAMRW
jgi:single-stranded-DNA-specific exonuclease